MTARSPWRAARLSAAASRAGGYARLTIHPDAETVHDHVKDLPSALIGMVIRHAKGGTRPDWMPGVQPTPEPVPGRKGKPKIEYFDAAKTKPAYCLVRYNPEIKHIEYKRGLWLAWWDALDLLAESLDGALTERKVLGLPFPREPWLVQK